MKIYIVRHGETDANTVGCLQGRTDNRLNKNGVDLAIVTGRALKGIKFDYAYSSPLARAKETCEIILKESENFDTPIETDDRIQEISMGDWEGKKYSPTCKEITDGEIEKFFKGTFEFKGCPNGETLRELCDRNQEFLKELISKNDDRTYLVSTHGCALRAMLNFLYPDKEDFWHGHVPYNLAVSMLEAKDGKIDLVLDDMIYYDKSKCVDRYAEVED